ncbi:N-acetyltransferase [Sphingomonas sp.]|uniref:GNAT family N-acetyltransferase n=1 Tax=Sphingomonas sp. TaxID=28214 RepID=UPI001ECC04AE|nr:N-acetyltransferase [Sphingomonas sp.]MBX3594896.1 N-acetyltransferase [Sphingomonas sp.]
MTIAIRPATGGDVAAIDALLRRSFPAPDEANLVRQLCIDGDMVLTLVADDAQSGALAGMVAFSRMEVRVNDVALAAVALAPVAVEAAYRRQGVAEALIAAGHRHLADAGYLLSFVLGEPGYYGRFGYAADLARGFDSPYAGDYLMALALQDGKLPCGVRGVAAHAGAFAGLAENA